MKIRHCLLVAALPWTLSACGGDDEAAEGEAGMDTTSMAMPAPDMGTDTAGMAGMPSTVTLQAVGTSGASGQATIAAAGGQTQVTVQLSGLTEGSHAGHIHSGTCDNVGPPVSPLEPVNAAADGSGSATSTVALDANTVMNGQHVVQYHGDAASPGAPVACGQITQHTM